MADSLLDDQIRSGDPLEFDSRQSAVWKANASGDVVALIGMLREVVPAVESAVGVSLPASIAAMRDLGILMGSRQATWRGADGRGS